MSRSQLTRLVVRTRAPAQVEIQDHLRDLGGKEGLALLDGVEGVHQVTVGIGFQDVALGAGVEHLAHHLFGFVHGKDHNLGFGSRLQNFPCCVQPINRSHGDVHDHHIRLQFLALGDSVAPVSCFPADLPTGMIFEQRADSPPDHAVIVCHQNSCCIHIFRPFPPPLIPTP